MLEALALLTIRRSNLSGSLWNANISEINYLIISRFGSLCCLTIRFTEKCGQPEFSLCSHYWILSLSCIESKCCICLQVLFLRLLYDTCQQNRFYGFEQKNNYELSQDMEESSHGLVRHSLFAQDKATISTQFLLTVSIKFTRI